MILLKNHYLLSVQDLKHCVLNMVSLSFVSSEIKLFTLPWKTGIGSGVEKREEEHPLSSFHSRSPPPLSHFT